MLEISRNLKEVNPIRSYSDYDILRLIARFCYALLNSNFKKKKRLSSRRFFLIIRPKLLISILLCICTFHGSRSPQLENGTFERVNASVRDRRACSETKESGFTLLRQCFRNNVFAAHALTFYFPWQAGCSTTLLDPFYAKQFSLGGMEFF